MPQAVGVIVLPLAAVRVGWENRAAFLLPVIGIAAAVRLLASSQGKP